MFFDINLDKDITDTAKSSTDELHSVINEGFSSKVVAETIGLDIKPTHPLPKASSELFKIEYAHEDPIMKGRNSHPIRIEWITNMLNGLTYILYVNDNHYDLQKVDSIRGSEKIEAFVMSKLKENGIEDLAFDDIHKITIFG